jgi:RNA polymerase sigma-70 factor (ECF subfamily)
VSGDGAELTALLAEGVGMWSDGGGKAFAARRPLIGREQVVNFLIGLHRAAQAAGVIPDVSLVIADINSEPALVVRVGQRLESIFVISIDGDEISGIRAVRNPDKLARIDRKLTTLH